MGTGTVSDNHDAVLSPGPTHRWLAVAGEILLWAAVCTGIWLGTLSAVSVPELAVGGGVGVICGLLGAASRRVLHAAWPVRVNWLRHICLVLVSIPVDAARVLGSALADEPGRFETVAVSGSQGGRSRAVGRRAAYVLFVSLTPGSVVLDADPDTGSALVHVVGSGRPQAATELAR